MIPHDKHQYYFEKYLRNEMSYHERTAFDEKMAEDAELRSAFEFYKSHRIAMLHDLLEEHRLLRRDNRFNRLMFLLISLTGIALTFNYYLHRESVSQTETVAPGKKERKPLYTYIPFVNWEKRSEKTRKSTIKKDTSSIIPAAEVTEEEEPVEVLEPSAYDEERSANDIFLTDSFVTITDKLYFQQLLAAKKAGHDSLPPEPETPSKTKSKDRAGQLFVEFWQSPVKYRGYKFTGKKLILYGIEPPYEIYVYRDDQKTLYLIHPFGETELIEQPNFHAF